MSFFVVVDENGIPSMTYIEIKAHDTLILVNEIDKIDRLEDG